jgi:hypothetical protein
MSFSLPPTGGRVKPIVYQVKAASGKRGTKMKKLIIALCLCATPAMATEIKFNGGTCISTIHVPGVSNVQTPCNPHAFFNQNKPPYIPFVAFYRGQQMFIFSGPIILSEEAHVVTSVHTIIIGEEGVEDIVDKRMFGRCDVTPTAVKCDCQYQNDQSPRFVFELDNITDVHAK